MQIKLGEKIKELRQRDQRKQEDLAVALGVTNQAVSRWEANGGYPDIEMLPAIANYFHITIDELFGYDSDRQTKLQSYIKQADQIHMHGDNAALVDFLRDAISEFPSEWQLQYRLANRKKYFSAGTDGRLGTRCPLCFYRIPHQGIKVLGTAVMIKHSLSHSQAGLDALLAVVRLYESILDDGNCGIFHNDMCMLYLNCSSIAVHLEDFERALNYCEIALDHFLEFSGL